MSTEREGFEPSVLWGHPISSRLYQSLRALPRKDSAFCFTKLIPVRSQYFHQSGALTKIVDLLNMLNKYILQGIYPLFINALTLLSTAQHLLNICPTNTQQSPNISNILTGQGFWAWLLVLSLVPGIVIGLMI